MTELNLIKSKLISILKQCNEIKSSIDICDKLQDLGFDSIIFIKFIIMIESEFGFEFDNDFLEYRKFETIVDIAYYINKKLK